MNIGPMRVLNWRHDLYDHDDVAKRVGLDCAAAGYKSVLAFGFPGDPAANILRQSVEGAGLLYIPGSTFSTYSPDPPRVRLADIGKWTQLSREADRFGASAFGVWLEDLCGMNDFAGITPIQAVKMGIDVATGLKRMVELGVTPLPIGCPWRPGSFAATDPYARFLSTLYKRWPLGAYMIEENAIPHTEFADHPLAGSMLPCWQAPFNPGGVKTATFFAEAGAYGVLDIACRFGEPIRLLALTGSTA